MTTLTEGRHTAEFILSEANGSRSRENGTVKSGETLVAGEVLKLDGSDLVSRGASGTVVGVIIDNVDATDGAVDAAYLARDAEVNHNCLTYADSDTDGDDAADGLADLGIISRR